MSLQQLLPMSLRLARGNGSSDALRPSATKPNHRRAVDSRSHVLRGNEESRTGPTFVGRIRVHSRPSTSFQVGEGLRDDQATGTTGTTGNGASILGCIPDHPRYHFFPEVIDGIAQVRLGVDVGEILRVLRDGCDRLTLDRLPD